jgi:hypothetical protein
VPYAARRAVLAALVILPACSHVATPQEAMPTSAADPATPGPDPDYGKLIAARLKDSFKTLSSYDAMEISPPRWVQSNKGWSWLACVHFQDRGHRRTYAVFFNESEVVDGRYAIGTDDCDRQSYSPFDLDTGAMGPGAVNGPGPLY